MGLKSVPKHKKPTTIMEPPSSSSSDDDDNDTAISATSSSSSSASKADVPTPTSSPNADLPTATPAVNNPSPEQTPTPVNNPTPEKTPSPEPIPAVPISSKRPAESETVSGSSKRAKKDEPSAPVPSEATGKKKLFQRIWSDEDEIAILKGIIDYKEEKGVDPMADIDDFMSYVKKSLVVGVDIKRRQMREKIVRLKKRFTNAKKKNLTDPHEIKAFEISKKIWGRTLVVDEIDDEFNFDKNEDEEENKKGKEVKRSEEKEEEGVKEKMGGLEIGFKEEDGEMVREVMKRMGDGERSEFQKMVNKSKQAYLEAYLFRLRVLKVAALKLLAASHKDSSPSS